MKNIIKKLLTFIILLFVKNIKTEKSIFLLCKSRIATTNTLKLIKAYVSRLNIYIDGHDNKASISGLWRRGELVILGNNNNLIIEEGCYLTNTRIIIRGNNCSIAIGKDVTSGSLYMACMGQGNYITIGDDCMLSENVNIWSTDSHGIYDMKDNLLNPSKPVKIGSHVWLGKGSSVLKGATIGDGAIVGMDTMVNKDIIANTLVVGTPMRTVKENILWKRGFIDK